jgi:hypothetical protein
MSNERTNYGTLIISSLKDFQKTFPDMTFGEIMYSFLRQNELTGKTLKDIRTLSDEDIYQSIEKSIKYEQDEPLKPQEDN